MTLTESFADLIKEFANYRAGQHAAIALPERLHRYQYFIGGRQGCGALARPQGNVCRSVGRLRHVAILPAAKRYTARVLFNWNQVMSGIKRCIAAALSAVALMGAAIAQQTEDDQEIGEVNWSHERCEYILVVLDDGYGIITQFSAERLKAGDKISAAFHFSINSGKKFINQATGETGMLRGAAFGLTRAQALKRIQGICKRHAPKE